MRYDAGGQVLFRSTWLLEELGATQVAGEKQVRCLKYTVLLKEGGREIKGSIWTSREVPGGTVRADYEVTEGGTAAATIRDEALDLAVQ
jgi:hypothetical protein